MELLELLIIVLLGKMSSGHFTGSFTQKDCQKSTNLTPISKNFAYVVSTTREGYIV